MTLQLKRIHHAAIICSNYEQSKYFYTAILGLQIIAENYRPERCSYKLDLAICENSQIELFSFPDPPERLNSPEACGLRHLAFQVDDIEKQMALLKKAGIAIESLRVDEYTGKKFVFFLIQMDYRWNFMNNETFSNSYLYIIAKNIKTREDWLKDLSVRYL